MNEGSTLMFASPALDHIIERPRLIKIIEDADARVILFAAPAGYGKTTLAKQWSARQTGPVAWYRTTRASGDVGALAVGLDEVLAKATNPKHRDPKRIESIASVNPNPAPLARALISTYRDLGPDLLLVLDEWEAAGTVEADQLAGLLVEGLPIRFLVTSRARPPWLSVRLEVYGEAVSVGSAELAMTETEAVAVLSRDLKAPATQELVETAGGWPAVLGLAAIVGSDSLTKSGRASQRLYDYLASELLEAASEPLQEAITLLAIGAIDTVATARLIASDGDRDLIEEASALGLTYVDSDEHLSVHPLFRELLVDRASRAGAARRADLASRSRPLIEACCWDEALAVAEASRDPEFTSDALAGAVVELLSMQRVTTVDRWVAAGHAAGVTSPIVDYAESEIALRRGEFDRALVLASHASARLRDDMVAKAHLAAARAAHLGGRPDECEKHINVAIATAGDAETLSAGYWLRFAHGLESERTDAADVLAEFAASADGSLDHDLRLAHGWLNLGLLDGDLPRRLRAASATKSLCASGVDPMVRSSFLNIYSNAQAACGEFGRALTSALEEMEVAVEYGLEFVKRYALINEARALIGLRRVGRAQRALAELAKRLQAEPDGYLSLHHAIQTAGLYLSIGDLERAYAAVVFDPIDETVGRTVIGEYLSLRAIALAARGDADGAMRAARAAADQSRSFEVGGFVSVARAIVGCMDLEGSEGEAFDAIDELFESHALNALVIGLRAAPSLGEVVRDHSRWSERLPALLVHCGDLALARRLGYTVPRSTVRSRDLSARELEIHGLIAQGLTNKEIAKVLFISESTTKVHVRHILEKLGVRSRAEAARVWQEEA